MNPIVGRMRVLPVLFMLTATVILAACTPVLNTVADPDVVDPVTDPEIVTLSDGRVLRNVPYGGAFGPSDPPVTPVHPTQLPEALRPAERAALDVWYERPSPTGPAPIAVTPPKAIYAVGKGPVVQILPGPLVFPEQVPERLRIAYPPGQPYSNNTSVLPRGEIRFVAVDRTAYDTKLSLDSMDIEISLTDSEGNEWRVEQVSLAPMSSQVVAEPWFGGVVIDSPFHGNSGIASPALPLVKCMMCSYGWADVYKNGERVASSALLHVMLTTDSRDDSNDFAYYDYDVTDMPIRQIHIDVHPMNQLPSPGGFLHVTWENAEWQVGTPEEIMAVAPEIGEDIPTITLSAAPHIRWDQEEIHLKAGQKYRLLVSNNDPASFHQFHWHTEPMAAGQDGQPSGLRHDETMTAGRTGELWKPGDPGYEPDGGDSLTPRSHLFPLQQGSTWATIIMFEEPGEYEFLCPVGNHYHSGMSGKFIVTAP
jgi:uncharacterized cupredoxin-like copper-binding protein